METGADCLAGEEMSLVGDDGVEDAAFEAERLSESDFVVPPFWASNSSCFFCCLALARRF